MIYLIISLLLFSIIPLMIKNKHTVITKQQNDLQQRMIIAIKMNPKERLKVATIDSNPRRLNVCKCRDVIKNIKSSIHWLLQIKRNLMIVLSFKKATIMRLISFIYHKGGKEACI